MTDWRDRDRESERERLRKWRRDNPERLKEQRERARLKRYGITPMEAARVRAEQGNACAICLATLGDIQEAYDHDHGTGEFRGVLCRTCNRGLGLFGDDPETLIRAALYLETPTSRKVA